MHVSWMMRLSVHCSSHVAYVVNGHALMISEQFSVYLTVITFIYDE